VNCDVCAAKKTLNWNQMAVFYRTNAQSRVLEEEMLRANDSLSRDLRHALL
jgi:superfamily I DNA/RNA helicase